jgi:hypothetical protein
MYVVFKEEKSRPKRGIFPQFSKKLPKVNNRPKRRKIAQSGHPVSKVAPASLIRTPSASKLNTSAVESHSVAFAQPSSAEKS